MIYILWWPLSDISKALLFKNGFYIVAVVPDM